MFAKNNLKSKLFFLRELQLIYSCELNPSLCADQLVSEYGVKIRFGLKQGIPIPQLLADQGWEKETVFWLGNISLNFTNLQKVIDHYENKRQFYSKMVKSLIYPGLTIVVSLIILIIFGLFVFPAFQNIYQDLAIADSSPNLAWLALPIFGLVFFLARKKAIGIINYWRWLPIRTNALEILSEQEEKLAGCLEQLAREWPQSRDAVFYLRKGSTLTKALQVGGFLRQQDVVILEQAEKLGRVRATLRSIAREMRQDYYDQMEQVLVWFEPLVLIITGGLIGFIAYQLFRPVIEITQKLL